MKLCLETQAAHLFLLGPNGRAAPLRLLAFWKSFNLFMFHFRKSLENKAKLYEKISSGSEVPGMSSQ